MGKGTKGGKLVRIDTRLHYELKLEAERKGLSIGEVIAEKMLYPNNPTSFIAQNE